MTRWSRRRWWLLVGAKDGAVIYKSAYLFRSSAVRAGRRLTGSLAERWEVRRG